MSSTSYTSQKLKVFTTRSFRDSFKESTPRRNGYIFLSRSLRYPVINVVPTMSDTVEQEKLIWNDMILAKKVIPKDVEIVVPRYFWEANTKYKQYDDTISLENLLTPSGSGLNLVFPMYVINADGDVYKCLSNNSNSISTDEPIGNFTENDGFIQTTDGYLWKYMYNVKRSNRFLTEEWMPVPFIQPNTSYTIYNYNSDSVIQGTLDKIIVTNGGSNYYHTTLNVQPFLTGTNQIEISDVGITTDMDSINTNMSVSGTGIFENETYILSVDPGNPKIITLSRPTISSGGGNTTSNLISITTRVVIEGDGSNTVTSVTLNTISNTVQSISVDNIGVNYTKANVIIYGSRTATGAKARTVLSPKFGHGYNPAIEFGANNVMLISRIGEIDATENLKLSTDMAFHQYGLLSDPHKYGESEPMSSNTIDIVSQTMDITLLTFSDFTKDEMVYQGSINDPTFVGYVVTQDSNVVKLNRIYKTPSEGSLLIGSQSGKKNPVVSIKYPDLEPYTGDILFARNILKVQRSLAQAEEVKLVFQF